MSTTVAEIAPELLAEALEPLAVPFSIRADLWFECPCGAAFGIKGETTFADLSWFVAEQTRHRPQNGAVGCPRPDEA